MLSTNRRGLVHLRLASVSTSRFQSDIAEQVADLPGVLESTDVYEQVHVTLMSTSEPDDVVFLGVGADIREISPAIRGLTWVT